MWVRQGGGVREAALPCSRLRLDIQFSSKNIKLACWLQTVQSAGTFARHGDSRARFMHRSPRASQNLSVNVEMKEKHAFFFFVSAELVWRRAGRRRAVRTVAARCVEDIQVHSFLG